jgi:hypothetical protein
MAQVASAPPTTSVAPNIGGDIFYGDYAFKVNTNNGTIIYNQATPPLKLKDLPLPAPAAPQDFFDRAAESAQLDQLIGTNKRITIVGPDGVGKSTLMKQIANGSAAQKLSYGVVLIEDVDQSGTRLSLDDMAQQLFDQLYESAPPKKVTAASARVDLAKTQPLVLIDHVRFTSPDVLTKLIDLFPKSPILIAQAEAPIGNQTRSIDLGPLPHADAVQLFVSTLNQLGDKIEPAIDTICTLLQNLPLAIVTAANAVRASKLALDEALNILNQVNPPSADQIQASLERAYGLVYTTLSPFEREVLAIAAALPAKSIDPEMIRRIITGELTTPSGGQITREGDKINIGGIRLPIRDADTVPAKDDTQPTTLKSVSDAIDKLKAKGLLRANSPRLRIAPGLRSIAQAGVNPDAVHEQLIFQLLNAVRARKNLDWQYCADELGNLLGAIEWAAAQNRWNDVITLGRAIDPYLTLHGLWDAWRSVLDQILQAAKAINERSIEGWALHQIATRTIGSGDKARAIEIFRQALKLRTDIGDTIGAAYTQHNLDVLIGLPPTDRGRKEPDSRPPRSARSVGTGLKVVIGAAIAITAAAIILPRVIPASVSPTLAPEPTIAMTEVPASTPGISGFIQVRTSISPNSFNRSTGDWQAWLTVAPDRGQPPFHYAGAGWGEYTDTGPTTHLITGANCNPVNLTINVQSADGLIGYASVQYRPPECDRLATAVPIATQTPTPPTWPLVFFSGGTIDKGFEVFSMNSDGTRRFQVTRGLPQTANQSCYLHTGSAALSPDAKQIAYTQYFKGGAIMYLLSANGRTVDALTKSEYSLTVPSWSPDGSMLAVGVDLGGKSIIQIFDNNGRQIYTAEGMTAIGRPSWSPEGKQLVFNDLRDNAENIFMIYVDGSHRLQLTDDGHSLNPIWSPDGKRIAFVSYDATGDKAELDAMYADGSGRIALAYNTSILSEFSWSPDGSRVAFNANLPEDENIYVVNVDSLRVEQLTQQAGSHFGPIWSPDGSQIAFTTFNGRSFSDIEVINADGSGPLNLTDTPVEDDFMSYPTGCRITAIPALVYATPTFAP